MLTMALLLLLLMLFLTLPKLQPERGLTMMQTRMPSMLTKKPLTRLKPMPMPMLMPMKRPMKLRESTRLLLVSGRAALVRPRALASSPWFVPRV